MDGMKSALAALVVSWAWTLTAQAQEQIPTPPPREAHALSLSGAEYLAITYNPRMQEARARLDQARGQAMQATLYPNPRFDPGNPQQFAGSSSLYNGGVSQQVVVAGKLKLDGAAAERAVEQANFALARARFDLLRDVRKQFVALLAARDRVITGRMLVGNASRSAHVSQGLYGRGLLAKTDVLLLEIEWHRAEASLRAVEATFAGASKQLAAVIGIPNLAVDDVQGTLRLPLPQLDQCIERHDALARNSQLEIARLEIARTNILLKRAEVEPIPNPTVQSGYQYALEPDHNQVMIGFYFDIPIWNQNQGNIRSAGANVTEAVAALNSTRNDLLRQMADAVARYRAATQVAIKYEEQILPDAEQTLKLLQEGLSGGELDLFRVLQGQRAIAEARRELITAQQERLDAAIDIANLLQIPLVCEPQELRAPAAR